MIKTAIDRAALLFGVHEFTAPIFADHDMAEITGEDRGGGALVIRHAIFDHHKDYRAVFELAQFESLLLGQPNPTILVGYERNQTVDRDLLAGANLRGLAFIHLASLFLSRLRGLHYDRTGLKNKPVFAGSDLGLVWV